MPRPLSDALCAIIRSELQVGIDLETLKSRHRISDNKARAMMKIFRETGDVVGTVKRKPTGRPGKLKEVHIERLRSFLAEHPEAYLKDMSLLMELEFGIQVNESTMQRCCQRIGWSLKKQPRPRDELGFWTRTLPRDENDVAIRGIRPPKKRPEDFGKKFNYVRRRNLLEKSRQYVENVMSQPPFDASHDHNHIKRVLALSFEILRVEQNAFKTINFDSTIIELVALFHDIDDHKYQPPANMPAPYPSPPSNMDPQIQQTPPLVDLNSSIQEQSASDSFNTDPDPQNLNENESHVETLLLQLGWPDDIASKAAAITPFVSYTAEVTNKPGFASALAQYPELAVVQDADRLDAIGAVGIGRAFTYGGAKDREGGMAGTMNHFTEKLSRLEAMMKTGEGKRMAAARAERLRIFGRWWQAEMKMVGMANDGGMEWIQGVSPWANPDPSASNSVPSQPSNQRPADQASQAALKPGLDGMDEWQRRAGQNMGGDQPMGFPPSRALDQQQNTQNMSQEQVQEQEQEQEQRPANGEGIRPEAENDDPGRQLIEAFGSTAS